MTRPARVGTASAHVGAISAEATEMARDVTRDAGSIAMIRALPQDARARAGAGPGARGYAREAWQRRAPRGARVGRAAPRARCRRMRRGGACRRRVPRSLGSA